MRFLTLLAVLLVSVLPTLAQVAGPPVRAGRGLVAGPEPLAVEAGVEIMRAGGTAIDAAVAVGFALAVTLPSAGNLGGGGFVVMQTADGQRLALDFREMGPAGAHRDLYLGEDGEAIAALSRRGHLASGVPGSVAGLCHLQEHHGTLPLARVMEPAIRLARDGLVVSRFLERSLEGARPLLESHPESKRIFLAGGRGWREGELFRQPDLARTLERIAKMGPEGFYAGRVAELVAAEMARGNGIMTAADLAAYEVKARVPVTGTYRGHEIVSMPPPSSGGTALVQMLNLLEPHPVGEWGFGAERTLHTMTEAMRLAFRDRAHWMGDPDFSEVPFERLAAKDYAARQQKRISERAGRSEGMPLTSLEKEQTTHFSVMDAAGNAVACTTTLNSGYGSGVTITGAGFLMNNEMDDFAAAPGKPNLYGLVQGEANAVGARKRPLSSMTPTLVVRDGRVLLAIGSPGGPTIINTVLQCISNVVDHGMNPAQAVAAPRIHHQWLPDRLRHEPFGLNPDVARGLKARGHVLLPRTSPQGDAHMVLLDVERGVLLGAADPRNGGAARGF